MVLAVSNSMQVTSFNFWLKNSCTSGSKSAVCFIDAGGMPRTVSGFTTGMGD